jgi:hypothetical protein
MKTSIRLLTAALVLGAAVPALSAATATAAAAAPAAVMVANYTFDAGPVTGRVAENSGRGAPLTVRSSNGGALTFSPPSKTGRFVTFPAACPAATMPTCPRVLLEAANDADLNPGTQQFRWGASVMVQKTQVTDSSNVMQKGATTTDSQWKLQIGAKAGKAQCVVVGKGLVKPYIVRSSVTVADGKWHKLLCLRSGVALTVSVDGVNRGTVAVPATLSISNTRPMRIGGPNFTTTSDMFHGSLDSVYAMLG